MVIQQDLLSGDFQINKLEKTKWYEWDIQQIIEKKAMLEEIIGFDIDKFKENYFKRRDDMKVLDFEND
ncbi:hypothetical protein [Aliarcobacter butzleri]|uniref:hypothetical protein n=1 Tax=Aliarcobacter butzleri TaxID=28197 RepID=UPI002B24DC71|nr:hypothetical protein [Aliarcobacter butzleri]